MPRPASIGAITASVIVGLVTLSSCSGEPDLAFTPDASPGPAIVDGHIVLDFPRLLASIPWGQPTDDIARFDAVQGGWSYPGAVDEVKAVNPHILIFEATSGCEIEFDPDAPYGSAPVHQIPPEWFLTQVGSTLAEPVDATTTTFVVEKMTATADGQTVQLFAPGDAILIDTETALVLTVDEDAKSLTVQRGYVRPASDHPAGTRVAAHVHSWPGSWTMNISTLAPLGQATTSTEDESYAEYNARVGIALVGSGSFDGLFLDRTDASVAFMLNFPNIRSLDLDQSNTLVTDYAAYEEAWGEGIRVYETALREGLGDDVILYVNRGMANLDLLNGHHHEAFPMADGTTYGGTTWPQVMFGDGGYFTWLNGAREPRFVVIQTYADESIPPPALDTGGLETMQAASDCLDPGYEPDYRLMRFGLTTTLLGDGFFTFDWSTYAQSWRCMFWFDEYDNAGAGRGYLGQPLGDAFQPLADTERRGALLVEDFEDGIAGWGAWADTAEGYGVATAVDTGVSGAGSLRVDTTGWGGVNWRSAVSSPTVDVSGDTQYTVELWAKADAPHRVQLVIQQSEAPWGENASLGWIDVSETWSRHEVTGTTAFADPTANLTLRVGGVEGSLWLDDLTLAEGSDHVWRRDFEGGVVLVNATGDEVTIPLGERFRKIEGSQDPEVNDGSIVTEVTLGPLDGIILLRLSD
ncbi:MAG: carbohydrate binding domain-containing protein [Demequinaceae bacterium]|nr:carbohydrate binding domain-containing protein [Demequinaceae bacterium]